jgi:methyl-accepting chemotaxis protein
MRGIAFSRLLLLLVFVPVIALALFGGQLTYESWSRFSDLTRASSLLRLGVAGSRFAGIGMPAEGAASRDYLAGGDKAKLDAQRKVTDDYYRSVTDAAAAIAVKDTKIDEHLKALDEKMREVRATRAAVDSKSATPAAATATFVATSGRAIDLIGSAAALASDAILSRRIFALYATLQFSNSVLQQRGAGQIALQEGKIPTNLYLLLTQGAALQSTFGKLFVDYAPAEMVQLYGSFNAANGAALQELRDLAMKNAGQPASEAQVKRWIDLNQQQTVLLNRILSGTADGIGAEGEQMLSSAWRNMLIYCGLTLAVFIAVIVLSRAVLRIVRDLLTDLVGAIDSMGKGNFSIAIPHVERRDEIGAMARATEAFRENFVRAQEAESERKNAESAAQRRSLMQKIAGDFESAVGGIVHTVSSAATELEATAGTLTRTAEMTQQRATAVTAASDEASTNVQAVSAATNEMTSSVQEISRQVQESSRIANEAVSQAQKTDARITELSQAAARIGDVVKLITAIAEQTNLLALNATIEAARAGEAGKGFAVVAQEVKALAAQTAKATDEIGAQISGMQAATQDSVAAIKEIGGTIGRIAEIASAIAAAVEEQGAATQEIARNVQQAAQGTTQVASNITEVNRGAGETGSASSEVLSSAQSLSQESSRLKLEVDKFLATVRAA